MSTPARAAEHLAEGRFDDAMDALLAAWRRHRAPELDDAVTALSELLARGLPAIDPEDPDWQREWEARASQKRAAELGALSPHVTRPPKGGIPRRVRMLLAFGPDPRIAASLLEIIEHPPTTASSNFSMWSELFAALPDHVDERAIDRLEIRAAQRGGKSQFWPKLEGWIAAVVPKLPETASLPHAWVGQLESLADALERLRARPPELESLPEPDAPNDEPALTELGPARASLESGELDRTLDQLVSFWSQCRSPVIAEAIERLGLLVDAGREPPGGRTKKTRHAAWIEAADQARPHAIGPLLASAREGRLADVEARIEAMLRWRPDPRVAQLMVVITKDYMLGARDGMWRAVYEVLVHHADPRVADYVRQRHARLAGAHVRDRHRSEGRALRRVFDEFCEAADAVHELSIAEHEQAAAIASLLAEIASREPSDGPAAKLERALIEAIVADWDSDDPRLVYADWLQQRDDPRGEFMALDLALHRGERVRGKRDKLFDSRRDELFGPLRGLIGWQHEFERGLLTKAQISTRKGGLDMPADRRREMLEDLRWATLREMRVAYDDLEVAAVLEHAPLWALASLERPSLAAVAGFARREHPVPLRSLELSGRTEDDDASWAALSELAPKLPELEHMAIMIWTGSDRGTPPVACFASELVRRLKLLTNGAKNTGGFVQLDEWIARMVAARCPVPRLQIIAPKIEAEVHQVELGGFEVELTLDGARWDNRRPPEGLVAQLTRLPRDRVTAVRISEGVVDGAFMAEIEAAIAGLDVEWVAPPASA